MTTYKVVAHRGLLQAEEEYDTIPEARAAERMAKRIGVNFHLNDLKVSTYSRASWQAGLEDLDNLDDDGLMGDT